MKQIHRTKGNHKGVHYIFEDYSEAIKYLTGELSHLNVNQQTLEGLDCFPYWMNENVKEGDWVTADDGKVIQILRIHHLYGHKKANPTPYDTICIKTAGVYAAYTWRKNGNEKYSKYGMKITPLTLENNVYQQTLKRGKSRYELKMIRHKRMFAYYLAVYLSPVMAYKMCWDTKWASRTHKASWAVMHREAYNLLKDPFVVRELEGYMSIDTFRNRLSQALKLQEIDEKRIVNELATGLDEVKKGSQTHKQFIELATNMLRYTEEKENIGIDGKPLQRIEVATEHAEYDMLPAPPKAIYDDIDDTTKQLVEERNKEVEEKQTLINLQSELNEVDLEENSLGRLMIEDEMEETEDN